MLLPLYNYNESSLLISGGNDMKIQSLEKGMLLAFTTITRAA